MWPPKSGWRRAFPARDAKFVLDNTAISNFTTVGRMDALCERYGDEEVVHEILKAEVEVRTGRPAIPRSVCWNRAAGVEDWAYTYENLDSETQSSFTEDEWFQKNQWFANNGEVIYHIVSASMVEGAQERLASVALKLTYEDGSSSTRETYFVYEYAEWKHRFG